MRKIFITCSIILLSIFQAKAQEGKSTFDFLRFSTSAHASALGGTNVSLVENDLSLIYQNPAFLGQEMSKSINLNYLFYLADIGVGSATFAHSLGDKSSWGVGVNYTNYGEMTKTDYENDLGDLSAKDICGNVFFSRDLTEKIRGGVTAKFVYSAFDTYTAIGLGVDLGLSYYDNDKKFAAGLVGKNIGRQVKAYDEELANMPWDIQIGITKGLAHAPIRFSVTGMYLKQWSFYNTDGSKDSGFATLMKHFVFGVDITPSENLWIGVGYNVKTGADMKLQQGNKMGGFSIGAGLKVKSFNIGCSLVNYHPSATSFLVSLSTSLGEPKL